MLLGKRGRPPMKRTTSMKEFTMDLNSSTVEGAYQPLDPHNPFNSGGGGMGSAAVAPGPHRRKSADFVQTAHFMRVCSLCKCRLIPGHDIYMYRGDTAFCSLECRQQKMTQDERKEKCSSAAAAGAQVSATGEKVAAV